MMRRRDSERGAILIQVAIALIGLLAFSALTIDYGVMWVSRGQAQNAADAAALAGATSLAFVDRTDTARARYAAEAAGEANAIWGQAPDIDPAADITVGTCPPSIASALDLCVRANVYRKQGRQPLPTFFATLLGITQQGVQATATARVLVANSATCVRPWAIPDKWYDLRDLEHVGLPAWTWDDKYERYVEQGENKGALLVPADCYHAALTNFQGDYMNNCPANIGPTSFNMVADRGTVVTLSSGKETDTLVPSWYFPVDLPRPDGPASGADRYRENIATCNSLPVTLGQTLQSEPGAKVGPTRQGVDALYALDPGATWNGQDVVGGAYGTNNSPRIVPVPVFNVEAYTQADKTNGKFTLQITNLLGFFVLPMEGDEVRGVLMPYRGDFNPGGGSVDPDAAFLYTVVLVR